MGMKIRTFQEYGIPEPVTQSQVDPDRCMYIGKEFFKNGFYGYFLLQAFTYKM